MQPSDLANALNAWRDTLVNLSGVNRLIRFRASRTGSVIIASPSAQAVYDDLRSRRLAFKGTDSDSQAPESEDSASPPIEAPRTPDWSRLSAKTLGVDRPDKDLGPILRGIMRRANAEFLDRGLHVLYIAFGMLKWTDDDDNSMQSPVLLVPVDLESDGPRSTPKVRIAEDDLVINPALAIRMREFGISLPVINDWESDELGDLFDGVRRAIKSRPSWAVEPRVVLSQFSFHKEAMYKDLQDNEESILDNPLVRALATSDPREQSGELLFDPISAEKIDELAPPEKVPTILDADSSQRAAIAAAVAGKSFVMDGPPGTGKSQSIANMIAVLLHAGRTVLFVSEKAAALEVVRNRLADIGLDNYLLELHSHKASRKEVATALSDALDRTLVPPSNGMDARSRNTIEQRRKQLNAYAHAMNEVRDPLGMSVHHVLGILANLVDVPAAPAPRDPPDDLTLTEYQEILDTTSRLERNWRPATQGASFLWKDAIDKTSLETRLFQASDALQVLSGIVELNGDVVDSFDLDSTARAATLNELITLHQRRPVDALDSWLSAEDFAPFETDLDSLRTEIRTLNSAIEAARETAGDGWELVPTVPDIPPAPQFQFELAPINVAALTAEQVRRSLAALSDQFESLRDAIADLAMIARELSVPPPKTFDQADQLLWIVGQAAEAAKPEVRWMTPDGLQAASEAAVELHKRLESLKEVRSRAEPTFKPAALDLPLVELHERFANQHKGLKKLSSEARADKAAIAAVLQDRVDISKGIQHLDDAIEWARAHKEFESAAQTFANRLGAHWHGENTRFDDVRAALGIAQHVIRIVPDAEMTGVPQYVAHGQPNAGLEQAAMRATRALHNWKVLCANPPTEWPQQSFHAHPIESSIDWLQAHLAPLEALFSRTIAVDQAMSSNHTVADAEDKLEARARVVEARQALEARAQQHAVMLGDHYRGQATDLNHLSELFDWVRAVRTAASGPLSAQQLKDFEAIRATTNLGPAVDAWTEAVATILSAFSVSRQDDLRAELDGLFQDARELLEEFRADTAGQDEWFAYVECKEELSRRGLDVAVDFCERQSVSAEQISPIIERALLRAWADHTIATDARLSPVGADDRMALVDEYRKLDNKLVRTAVGDIIRAVNARRPPSVTVGEQGIIRRQGMLKRRHKAVRELIAETRSTALALKPCFMMSPLAVSQYLPTDMRFDTVIFDEASQVTPGDAINCVYRGRSLILAGDDKQLPPTSFFDRVLEESEEADTDVTDFKSVLELAKGSGAFRSLGLRWHYRSRHESLIDYSNHKFYRGDLITYPSALSEGPDVGVEFIHAGGVYRRGTSADNPIEAAKVAERVIDHFTNRPAKSLGVVTFSVAQADAVYDAVERAREQRRDLDEHFESTDRLGSFFIKSLESVQGDERDVMIMSVGYGPDELGKISTNFGAINKDKGWRRLNVAITRARERVEVIASMSARDIPSSTNENVQYLQAYLDFAERGQDALNLDLGPSAGGPESPFEESVIKAIRSWGYAVESQVGAAGFRIDVGVQHPRHQGVFALGVECDGYQYHSSPVARDRDRLRDQVLRDLGWRLHRIWGTAWYRNRTAEEERLKSAIESAVKAPIRGRLSIDNDRHRPVITTEEVPPEDIPSWTSEYETASVGKLPHWIDPSERGSHFDMVKSIEKIAKVEGPVHVNLVVQRLRQAWGIGRASSKVRENIDLAIRAAEVIREGDFIDLPSRPVDAVRRQSNGVNRRADEIHIDELALAVEALLHSAGAVARDDLIVATARTFGWSRTGSDIQSYVRSAIDRLITQEKVVDHDGLLRLHNQRR